jgi:hypothetical protein
MAGNWWIAFAGSLTTSVDEHRVLMYFSRMDGYWYCAFFDDKQLNKRLPMRVKFRDPSKISELACRGNANLTDPEVRRALDHGIQMGRGKVWLRLSDQQRAKLDHCAAA